MRSRYEHRMGRFWKWAAGLAGAALLFLGWGYANILRDPVMRETRLAYRDWPAGARPLRVALIGDVHVQGPDMPTERVARLAALLAKHRPDLILLAGDFVGDRKIGIRDFSDTESRRRCAASRRRWASMRCWAITITGATGRRCAERSNRRESRCSTTMPSARAL